MNAYHFYKSPLGWIKLGATHQGLSVCRFVEERPPEPENLEPFNELKRYFESAKAELDAYFSGKNSSFQTPLDYSAQDFRLKVWNALLSIPYGETRSYQQIAEAIGSPQSARAVGTACKENPLALFIPCHRVIKSSGEEGLYRGGTAHKHALLTLEKTREKP